MFSNILNWFLSLWSVVSNQPPTPDPTPTVGNKNTIPETKTPNHTHLPLQVEAINMPQAIVTPVTQPVANPKVQSLVVIPNGGVLTKADIIDSIVSVEGGYVNNPDDAGGETNFGITAATAKAYTTLLKTNFNWNGTMKSLTKPMAVAIYEAEYWNRLKLDSIYNVSPFLADKLFDIGVNIGIRTSATWLQQALNVFNRKGTDYKDITVDGVLGSGSLAALDGLIKVRGKDRAVKTLLKALITRQGAHYQDISLSNPKNETFVFGWFERLDRHIDLYMS